MTQKDFGEIIGMSQSNISKALSESDKRMFTVEQLISIADVFNISLDELVGRKSKTNSISLRTLGELIVSLFEKDDIKSSEIEVSEDVWVFDTYYGWDPKKSMQTTKYNAIYFPNYWLPVNGPKTEKEFMEFFKDESFTKNDTIYVALNEFLDKFIQIFRVYRKNQIAEGPYRIVVNNYLDQLDDRVSSRDFKGNPEWVNAEKRFFE